MLRTQKIAPNARAKRGVTMSPYRLFKYALLASAAAIVMEPGPVFAQGRAKAPSNAELQARLQALEAQMQTLQSELSAAKQAPRPQPPRLSQS
jgi:hypothetical protein